MYESSKPTATVFITFLPTFNTCLTGRSLYNFPGSSSYYAKKVLKQLLVFIIMSPIFKTLTLLKMNDIIYQTPSFAYRAMHKMCPVDAGF